MGKRLNSARKNKPSEVTYDVFLLYIPTIAFLYSRRSPTTSLGLYTVPSLSHNSEYPLGALAYSYFQVGGWGMILHKVNFSSGLRVGSVFGRGHSALLCWLFVIGHCRPLRRFGSDTEFVDYWPQLCIPESQSSDERCCHTRWGVRCFANY